MSKAVFDDVFGDWENEAPKKELSLAEMQALVEKMQSLGEEYDAKESELKDIGKKYDEVQAEVLAAIESAGLKSFDAQDCKVTITMREQYALPKDDEQLQKLYAFIAENQGSETLEQMRKINSQTLNKWANEFIKEKQEQGEAPSIEGLEAPFIIKKLSVRKK